MVLPSFSMEALNSLKVSIFLVSLKLAWEAADAVEVGANTVESAALTLLSK